MFATTIVQEDTTWTGTSITGEIYTMVFYGNLTGRAHVNSKVTAQQFSAFLILVGSEGGEYFINKGLTEDLYKIAEEILKDCPSECRPIP